MTNDELKLELLQMKVGHPYLTPSFFISQYPEYEDKRSHVENVFYMRRADGEINNLVRHIIDRLAA